MNEMYEIYKSQNDLYDELVSHEDHELNLKQFLLTNYDFTNKTVCELGVGTGRVTKMYIDKVQKASLHDISDHMLQRAKVNLLAYNNKIEYKITDNKHTDQINDKYDYVIEGWSFGHLILQEANTSFWIEKLIKDCKKIAATNIWIESMGTFVDEPMPPTDTLAAFYYELKKNGFTETVIRTDYKFENSSQAKYVLGSFFGKEMGEKIEKKREVLIKEFTGIWTFTG